MIAWSNELSAGLDKCNKQDIFKGFNSTCCDLYKGIKILN